MMNKKMKMTPEKEDDLKKNDDLQIETTEEIKTT